MKEGIDFEIIKTEDENGNVIRAEVKMLNSKAKANKSDKKYDK